MPEAKKLVIIECGVTLSPFTEHFLKVGKFVGSVIANSVCDFVINNIDESGKNLWIPIELINIIKGIIQDDLTKSPLALLYSRTHFNNVVPLTPNEQFLANWLSEKRISNEKDYIKAIEELFNDIVAFANKPIKIYPLNFDYENGIKLSYRDQIGFIRLYQLCGQLNLDRNFTISPNDISETIGANVENNDKKVLNYVDKKILSSNGKKSLDSADCIVISPSDSTSLYYMLNNKEIFKAIGDSKALVIIISPIITRKEINSKEAPLLKLIGKNNKLDTFFEQMKDICDTLVIDIGDVDMARSAQEKGLQVKVEDLLEIKDSYSFINSILKEGAFNILDISI